DDAYPYSAPSTAIQADLAHQPFDRAACHRNAVLLELVPHLVGAVDGEVLVTHSQHLGFELGVSHRSRRERSVLRPVIGRWGDRQHRTDRLDSPPQPAAAPALVLVDEADHRFDWRSSSAPKKVAAAFKMSFARR